MRNGGYILLGAVAVALRNVLPVLTAAFVGNPAPPPSRIFRRSNHVLRTTMNAAPETSDSPPRPSLPDSADIMCQQAADAVMRAYRDGWTRQTVRLRTSEVFNDDNLYNKGLGALLEATIPLVKTFTRKLWYSDSLKEIKTSALDEDAGTLFYREAMNPLQDAAVLYLAGRDVVTSAKVRNFFSSMGDRLVVLSNTEQAPAQWKVENEGRDFYLVNDAELGVEIADQFRQQSYYLWQAALNNWQVTYFRAYPYPWEIYIETLEYETFKLGEYESKPEYDMILADMVAYETENNITAFRKVGKMLKDNQYNPDMDEDAKDGGSKDGIEGFLDGLKKMF